MRGSERGQRIATVTGLTAGATLALAGTAQAGTFTVSNTSDCATAGCGSLRAALQDAQSAHDADTVTFASGLTGRIALNSFLPYITDPVTIQGPGPDKITVNGNGFYAFQLSAPAAAATISGLTITGSEAALSGYSTSGAATLSNVVISGNNGAIPAASLNGNLTISGSTLTANRSSYEVAAVFNGGTLNIANTTISGNVLNNPDPTGSTYGGVYVGSGTKAVITNSTISSNSNTGANPNPNSHRGGGIHVAPASGMLAAGLLTVQNTIVAGNTTQGGVAPDVFGAVGASFSLIGNPSGATISDTVPGSTLTNVNPQLGPLQNNGGSVPTEALPATSPAVDKGSSLGASTDARGLPRPVDFPQFPNSSASGANGADIGAFELQPAGGAFTFKKLKRNKKNGTATQQIQLPVPDLGTLKIFGKGLKTKTIKAASASGVLNVPVKAKGKQAKKLKRSGKLKLTEKLTYTPQGGAPVTQKKKIKLLRSPKK